jgi:dTDP-4-amino-4,6-dideoxygalactose transaminase
MTELQAAVGIAQLKKLKKVVAFRIKNAELLSEQLKQIDGLILPPTKLEFVGSYYAYCFGIELEKFSVGNIEFAKALKAEGVPATAGYLPKPLYQYPVLEKMITYGSSKCPFYCTHLDISNKDNFYRDGLCPQAEQACRNTILLEWNEAYDSKLVKNIADAIEKVFSYYRK